MPIMYPQISALLAKTATLLLGLQIALAAQTSVVYVVTPRFPDQASIRAYVTSSAIDAGIPTITALWVADRESAFDPTRTGDTDKICSYGPNKGKQIRSRGLWQINDCAHPEVDDATAYDVVSSTAWAMPYLKTDPGRWSTYRFCKEWFPKDCPLK